jgi:nitrate/TMAO reductase-like tetraheme cytochrome c subunit
MLKKIWSWPNSRWLLGIPIGGFIMLLVGVMALGTTNYIVHETSNTEFCFSCHSHEQNIRAEYEASSHFSNASGVRAECADCHLPQDSWFDLMATKIVVSRDIIPELMGNLDTPEKWEAHRSAMAESVWAEYRENDSAYCRSCHLPDAMVGQSRMATSMHRTARDKGRTCIDCHKGMVHKLPADKES